MTLSKNEIHLFITRPDDITEPGLLKQYEALLSDDERSKLPKFYHPRHRHQYLITRALQRTALSNFCDVEPAEWRFEQGTYGKPSISHPTQAQDLSFNLSHTAGLIICGITKNAEIGVDVEDGQRSTRTAFSSLFSYFSPEEIQQLESLPRDQQKPRFFQHWTLKEAYIKARGAGFAIPLNQFGFLFEHDRLSGFFIREKLDGTANDWQFWHGSYAQRYPLAIAIRSRQNSLNIISQQCVPLRHSLPCELFKLRRFSNT